MPKSEAPRKKQSSGSSQLVQVKNAALALDRRRQAQIANQTKIINNLLARFDEAQKQASEIALANPHSLPGANMPTSSAVYDKQFSIAVQGASVLAVENEQLRQALSGLVSEIDRLRLDQLTVAGSDTNTRPYFDALSVARTLVADEAG